MREKAVQLEGRIETQTAKAYLVEFTNNGQMLWLPKSQTYDRQELGGGLWLFSVSEWWVSKNPGLFGDGE